MNTYDVIVVGAGHAGVEASLAAARMGLRTACITLRLDRIGYLPCNCSIGGPAKGHIAREVDALGGQMALTTDRAMTHIRRVGTGKGPAVQTLRAHVCKTVYPQLMREVLTQQPNLDVIQDRVDSIRLAGGNVSGVVLGSGSSIDCRAVVLTTGTFLNGLCHEGQTKTVAARNGDEAVFGLSAFLRDIGVNLRRFKTGTTPRVRFSTIDRSRTEEMPSEPDSGALSFVNDQPSPLRPLLSCWQTWTNAATHDVVRENLGQSAMYSGQIEGVGPRYCPSIEDKIVRFAEKESHPIFLEIEEWDSESVYVQGVSTSLPADVQLDLLRTVPGLENVEMLRPGYAVEYDMADPLQLTAQLMSKLAPGLFLAGQLNGTSGYEEAAGQGIVAGINAARFAREEAPLTFARDNSFIGVMIDDLVTKGVEDPYRMLTARAEHRLLLRHDNADARLTPLAKELGLCSEARWSRFAEKQSRIEQGVESLITHAVLPTHNPILADYKSASVDGRLSFVDLLKRPEMRLTTLEEIARRAGIDLAITDEPCAREQIELMGMYDGYIQRQRKMADQTARLDAMPIPAEFDFARLPGLSYESREKMTRIRPQTVGQASRIPGVRPSDVALMIGCLRGVLGRADR